LPEKAILGMYKVVEKYLKLLSVVPYIKMYCCGCMQIKYFRQRLKMTEKKCTRKKGNEKNKEISKTLSAINGSIQINETEGNGCIAQIQLPVVLLY
jgi:hypothetical protein